MKSHQTQKYVCSLFLLLLCFVLKTESLQAQIIDTQQLDAKINSLIPNTVNDTTPGLVVGVVSKGELIFSKGYGMANMAYKIPNSPEMVYNLGSVTKQFLGYAFAMLAVEGKLSLDDPVTKFLEDWPEFKEKVTLRNLLTHTSGYREAYFMSNIAGREIGVDRLSRKENLEVVRRQPELEFVPGSRHTYNSTAWVILAEILTKVTGESADQWVIDNIFKPLGMNHTQIEEEVGEIISNAAESYYLSEKGYFINPKSNRALFGAADIYTSVNDMVNWINNFKTGAVGGKKVLETFLDPFILNDGTNSEYALGIGVDIYKGLKRYRHTGSHEAFITQLSYYPDQDLGIFTVSNYGGSGVISTTDIADLLLAKYLKEIEPEREIKTDDKALKNYEGLYVSDRLNNIIKMQIKDGELIASGSKVTFIGKDKFLRSNFASPYRLSKNENGDLQFQSEDGGSATYTRTAAWEPNTSDLEEFKGDYWNDEVETLHHINLDKGQLVISNRWLGSIPMQVISKDYFDVSGAAYLKFNRNASGAIESYSLYSGRTLNVVFNKK